MNLAEFAAANQPKLGSKCWLCSIPERAEVEENFRKGVPQSVIHAWLVQKGYKEVSRHRIANHVRYHLGE